MPFYEYLCNDCGPFTDMRPMAECDAPQDCPAMRRRVAARDPDGAEFLLHAPQISAKPTPPMSVAPTRPRPSANTRASHAPGCGCCSTKPSRLVAKSKSGGKSFSDRAPLDDQPLIPGMSSFYCRLGIGFRGGAGPVTADGLRVKLAGHLDRRLADIEEGATPFLHQHARTLVEALSQFANGLDLLEQFAVIAARNPRKHIIDLCQCALDPVKGAGRPCS